jgi:glycosyltransferase involved in cell wall biosynthesis
MMEETLQGGTRLKGESPVKEARLPIVSVITVVRNGSSLIEKTIRSVIAQTYPNIEYIVIDGGSSDGTAEIVRRYENRISYWISEPDRGIYDAMNKGLAAATGDYVWFMNAGDRIYADDILEKIFEVDPVRAADGWGTPHRAEIYYGDTMIVNSEHHEIGLRRLRPPEVLTWKSFQMGMLVCHQAILVSREIAAPFDPQYKHAADFDWVVRALKKAQSSRREGQGRQEAHGSKAGRSSSLIPDFNPGIPFPHKAQGIINTHRVLCAFLEGGHSKKNMGISLWERFRSMVRHYGVITTVLRHIPISARLGWYYLKRIGF